jgi:hypothetical protein
VSSMPAPSLRVFSAALHCTALHCTALHCTTHHTALHCAAHLASQCVQHDGTQPARLLCCTALHCTALHCTAPHSTQLCTVLLTSRPSVSSMMAHSLRVFFMAVCRLSRERLWYSMGPQVRSNLQGSGRKFDQFDQGKGQLVVCGQLH